MAWENVLSLTLNYAATLDCAVSTNRVLIASEDCCVTEFHNADSFPEEVGPKYPEEKLVEITEFHCCSIFSGLNGSKELKVLK